MNRPRRFMTDRMRAIDATVTARVHAQLKKHGAGNLGIAHARIMADLGPGARPSELASRLGVTKAAVGQLVATLEKEGFVTRSVDPTDGRAQIVRPTSLAQKAFQAGRRELDKIESEWLELLGSRRLGSLAGSLEVLDRWQQDAKLNEAEAAKRRRSAWHPDA
jgi:DNA-binding MarR family transcriptional regulator